MINRDRGQSGSCSIGTVVNRDRGQYQRGQLGLWSIGTVVNINVVNINVVSINVVNINVVNRNVVNLNVEAKMVAVGGDTFGQNNQKNFVVYITKKYATTDEVVKKQIQLWLQKYDDRIELKQEQARRDEEQRQREYKE
ncbi:hypothetical protein RF55_11929 [Lasius niger]|uniref:Uncharacterized protein n=1 Tax=Lasius niger TaxID=67767 RepID=A0A0J7KDP5_LASNI|nr:hypothetical protein RF55_11929 [Lasius niger]